MDNESGVALVRLMRGLIALLVVAQAAVAQSPFFQAENPVAVTGTVVRASDGSPVAGARITAFTPSLSFFRETRTLSNGAYSLRGIPLGAFRLGVAAPGLAYEERALSALDRVQLEFFVLPPETEPGSWQVVGSTLPEFFDATDVVALRSDGWLMFCHDTVDPVLFDPRTSQKVLAPSSTSAQGCMNTTHLLDGSLLFVGGQDGSAPGAFMNAIPWVKRFDSANTWANLPELNLSAGRWYPGLARLNDGRVLVMGGGTAPNAERTDTCELFDPVTLTWSLTGAMGSKNEFAPSALLYTGKVLRSWGTRPQLYDPLTGTWTDTGAFVYPQRGFPGHSDHSLFVLTDGRALALGARRALQPKAEMTELYDPASGQWSAGTSPALVRSQAEVIYLPDGQFLVAAGDQGFSGGAEPNVLGIVKRCDLFEPTTGAWRRVADLNWYREYHAVTVLVPDGRVLTTGGTLIKFQFGPTSADIEAYSPPYLFRGVRPQISNPSSVSLQRGQALDFEVFPATKLTHAILMGVQTHTHWLDGGIPRRLVAAVVQSGARAQVVLPSDPDLLPLGWYMLFAMVDDIPSEAILLCVR